MDFLWLTSSCTALTPLNVSELNFLLKHVVCVDWSCCESNDGVVYGISCFPWPLLKVRCSWLVRVTSTRLLWSLTGCCMCDRWFVDMFRCKSLVWKWGGGWEGCCRRSFQHQLIILPRLFKRWCSDLFRDGLQWGIDWETWFMSQCSWNVCSIIRSYLNHLINLLKCEQREIHHWFWYLIFW